MPDSQRPRREPLQHLLEALATWRGRPTAEHLADVSAGLDAVTASLGATGARVELRASWQDPLAVGSGILVEPSDGALDARTDVTRVPLRVGRTSIALGQVVVAGDPDARTATAAAVVLAVELDWARVEVGLGAQRLEAFDAAARAVAGELDLERVLQVIVDQVRPLVGARYAALATVGPDGTFDRFITSGITAAERERIGHIPVGLGLLGHVVKTRTSTRVNDLAQDPHRHGFPPNHPPMRTFLGVPVSVMGESVGHLYLTDKQETDDGFDESDQRVVETLARHAGISIERARLHRQVQQLAIADERDRIGRDLHDGIIQSLYAVGLSLEDVPEILESDRAEGLTRIDRAIDELHAAIRDIRSFITGLQPEAFGQGQLHLALSGIADEARHGGLEVAISLDGVESATAIQSVDIVQFTREAVSNAVRHAAATHIDIRARRVGRALVLIVRDDGRGFDPTIDAGSEHHGLDNLRTRAHRLGGDVTIDSTSGRGTTVTLSLPVHGS